MNKYDIIFEALQQKVNAGILTLEDAEILNDLAYEKYISEANNVSIISEAKDCFNELQTVSKDFFGFIDKDVTNTIEEVKKMDKNAKIKLNAKLDKVNKFINEPVPDMLNELSKYKKYRKSN